MINYPNKYKNWSAGKQLMVSFMVIWLIYIVLMLLIDNWVYEEKKSLSYRFFHSTGMAIWMTIWWEWPKVKAVFKRKHIKKDIPSG